jgi:hypothetical protein
MRKRKGNKICIS